MYEIVQSIELFDSVWKALFKFEAFHILPVSYLQRLDSVARELML